MKFVDILCVLVAVVLPPYKKAFFLFQIIIIRYSNKYKRVIKNSN